MATSPIPPDPYEVLGVPRTCDIETVKRAHRKLVLKHHPDRIKDPLLQEQGKNEFQKVQQAYELLSDPTRRARYDDKVKLAELRREKMMHDSMSSARSTFSTTTYTARAPPSAAPSVRREMRTDGKFYEERTPESYFDPRPSPSRDRYEDPPLRTTARKSDSYEKRPSSSRGSEKKEKEKPRSGWDGPIKGMSMKMAFNMKKAAQGAKERTREEHARSAKTRDKEEQKARAEKQASSRYSRVDDPSDSDSDTVVPRRPVSRDSKASPKARNVSSPETMRTRPPPPPRSRSYEQDDDSDDTASKWERHHDATRAYIAESQKRPPMARSSSGAHVYWEKGNLKDHRRSGSDSDRRPSSSSKDPRRSAAAEARARPAMPTQNSAPNNLKANIVDREPQRSKTSYSPEPKPMPNLKRAETAPMPKQRKEGLSRGGSNLKHTETMHDSGYGSSSSPHTPEMRGESPPPRDSKRREKATKYQIVDPSSDDDLRKPRLNKLHSDDDRPRRHDRSPDGMNDRRERNERPARPRVNTDMRPGSSRAGFSPVDGRPSFHSSPRESPSVSRHNSGKLFGERSPDSNAYTRRVDPDAVRYAQYRSPEDYDSMPGSHFRPANLNGRRPSVY